jgi:hypothetical protein
MCAVTLARMKAENQAPMMRGLVETLALPIPLGLTLRWAVKELTGEELPPPKGLPVSEGHWFLEPLR